MRRRADDAAQIHRHRLPPCYDMHRAVLDLALHRIDGGIQRYGLLRLLRVRPLDGLERGLELLLCQSAHAQYFRVESLQLIIVSGDGVGGHVLSPFIIWLPAPADRD